MTSAIEAIFLAYDEGRPALFVTGRSLRDLTSDEEGKVRPIMEVFRRAARSRGLCVITYSLAEGIDFDSAHLDSAQDRRTVEQALRAHHLLDVPPDQNEVVRVIRGVSSLARTPTQGLSWSDGKPLRFALTLEFADHLVPGGMNPGTQIDTQLVAIELVHLTSQSLALRSSGNLIIFHGRESMIDDRVARALHVVRLPQPDATEKSAFLKAASSIYGAATFADGLTPESVVHLTTNTPNRGLESLLRASHRSRRTITAKSLAEQKNRDVEQLSENTLAVLDTARADNLELCGRNIATPRMILEKYGEALLRGDASMPTNVLLVGPPGSGKTDLALMAARKAGAAAYQILSPKDQFVGATERKARLQQETLQQWIPCVGFVDEVTEAFPMERSSFDGDSGASRAVMAAWLTGLSDATRAGRCLIIGTTNCPGGLGAAMDSRFVKIPVLLPVLEDFAGIVVATVRRLRPDTNLDATEPQIQEAARIFYAKGANPRHIRGAVSNALMIHGALTPETVLFAAEDLCCESDLTSAIYTDLWAVKKCSSRSFFPWAANPRDYPYPDHLRGIVDPATGDIRRDELDKRVQELKPHANV